MAGRILGPAGYDIRMAGSAGDALRLVDGEQVDLVLSDVDMPGTDGIELLKKLRERDANAVVVMMSAIGSIDIAMQAVRLGAFDFIQKPFDIERLRVSVKNALQVARLQVLNEELRRGVQNGRELIGQCPSMVRLRTMIERVAPTNSRVLILGENGTGKEVIADAVQRASTRRDEVFIKVNCGALPENLVESELLGHEKGAFTGASQRRKGRFELADGGTLFLDEIGDLSLDLQVKLLRVIQEGRFERVGGTQTLSVDVRLLAATNRDLAAMVDSGKFREDLYYRLNVVCLSAPPLRDRREDIPLLIDGILSRLPTSQRVRLEPEVYQALSLRSYPGNVRELENIIERLTIFFSGESIGLEALREVAPSKGGPVSRRRPREGSSAIYQKGVSYRDRLQQLERLLLAEALEEHDNNKVAAAESLGTDKSFFYRKCRHFGIG